MMKLIVPNKMSEIKLADYQKFVRLEGDDEFLARKAVEIFCNLKIDVILQMKAASLTKVSSILMNAFNERPSLTQRFKMDGKEFGFIPSIEEITVGELNDVDQYISDWSQMHRAMSVLFRPVVATFGNRYEIEKYEGSEKYAEKMKEMPLDVSDWSDAFFLDFRKRFISGYPEIFGEGDGDEFSPASQFSKKWGWLTIYHQLAGGDPLKFDQVAQMSAGFAFTYLTFEKDRIETENKILKKQLKK
jgi:hypothetical protein